MKSILNVFGVLELYWECAGCSDSVLGVSDVLGALEVFGVSGAPAVPSFAAQLAPGADLRVRALEELRAQLRRRARGAAAHVPGLVP